MQRTNYDTTDSTGETMLSTGDIEADTEGHTEFLTKPPSSFHLPGLHTAKPIITHYADAIDMSRDYVDTVYTKVNIRSSDGSLFYIGMRITDYPYKILVERITYDRESIAAKLQIKTGDYLLAVNDQDIHFMEYQFNEIVALFARIQIPCSLDIIVHRPAKVDGVRPVTDEITSESIDSTGSDLVTDGPSPSPPPKGPTILKKERSVETDGPSDSIGSDTGGLMMGLPVSPTAQPKQGSSWKEPFQLDSSVEGLTVDDVGESVVETAEQATDEYLHAVPLDICEMHYHRGNVANLIRAFDEPTEGLGRPSVESTVRAFEARVLIANSEAPEIGYKSYLSMKVDLFEDPLNEDIDDVIVTTRAGRYTDLLSGDAKEVCFTGHSTPKIFFEEILGADITIRVYMRTDKPPVFRSYDKKQTILWDMSQYQYTRSKSRSTVSKKKGFPVILACNEHEADQLLFRNGVLSVEGGQNSDFRNIKTVDDRFFQRQGFSVGTDKVLESVTCPFHFLARSLVAKTGSHTFDALMIIHGYLDDNNPLTTIPECAKFKIQ